MQLPKNSLISVFATSIVYKLSLIFVDLHMHDPITVATRSKSTRTRAVEAQGDLPGVYRELYWHCSEPLEFVAPAGRFALGLGLGSRQHLQMHT
jgi:hypothetical protein